MAGGKRLGRSDRKRVAEAVDAAEEVTGLQICVYLGPVRDDPRAHAESMFVAAGLESKPAVLVLVAPSERRVEIVTAPDVVGRLPDEACARSIDAMTPRFATGDMAGGLVAGVARLAEEAGPGAPPEGGEELPDLLEGY